MTDVLDERRSADDARYPVAGVIDPILGGSGRRLYMIAGILLAGLGLATIGFVTVSMFGDRVTTLADGGTVPYVAADEKPFKVRPDDPGGMDIPNRDKHIYGVLRGEDAPNVERLLAQPEQPLAPPLPPGPAAADPIASVDDKPASRPETKRGESADSAMTEVPAVARQESGASATERAAETIAASAPRPRPTLAQRAASSPNETITAPATARPSAAAPTPLAPKPMPPAASIGGGTSSNASFRVQLVAVRSHEQAEREWQRVVSLNRDLLAGLRPEIARAELGSQGTVYRLRAGPLSSEAAARKLCTSLAARRVGCLVIAPGA